MASILPDLASLYSSIQKEDMVSALKTFDEKVKPFLEQEIKLTNYSVEQIMADTRTVQLFTKLKEKSDKNVELTNKDFQESGTTGSYFYPFLTILSSMENQAVDSLERLTVSKQINSESRLQFKHKLVPLIKNLPFKRIIPVPNHKDTPSHFKTTNPSLVLKPDLSGYYLNVRTVNYYCDKQNNYHVHTPFGLPKDNIVRTQNVLYELDRELNVVKSGILQEATSFIKHESPVRDLEDIRLFISSNKELLCTATSREVLPNTTPQIVACKIDTNNFKVTGGTRLLSHNNREGCQKNWLPFASEDPNDGLHYCVYQTGPEMIIYNFDSIVGICRPHKTFNTGLDFQETRGSTAPIAFGINGEKHYISMTHWCLDKKNKQRQYFHRVIIHDGDLKPIKISQSFTFTPDFRGIEFSLSMCTSLTPGIIYMTYGKEDNEGYIAEVDVNTFLDLRYYDI
jgi:hypothetical protein